MVELSSLTALFGDKSPTSPVLHRLLIGNITSWSYVELQKMVRAVIKAVSYLLDDIVHS